MMNPYSFLTFFAFIVNSALGVYVFLKRPHQKSNQMFSLLLFSVVWWTFGRYMLFNSSSAFEALLWGKFTYLGVAFMGVLFLHFTMIYPKEDVDSTKISDLLVLLYLIPIFFALLLPTSLFISGVEHYYFGYDIQRGQFFYLFALYLTATILYGMSRFYRAYVKAYSFLEKKQMKYLLLAVSVVAIAGLFADIIMPLFGLRIFPAASWLTVFMAAFIARGMHKYDLMVITPATEDDLEPAEGEKSNLQFGYTYLFIGSEVDQGFDSFVEQLKKGSRGLAVSRMLPKHVRQKYKLKTTPVLWLSESTNQEEEVVHPKLEQLFGMMRDFIYKTPHPVILLDGLEFLISYNNFELVMHFIQSLRDYAATNEAIVIFTLNPQALDPRQLKQIEREMDDVFKKEEETTQ
ncbi:MAG: DUF835 domain-containing protein [Candidatus Altiarchaeota archaeon]